MLIKNPTQKEKILKVLQEKEGEWVSGNVFLRQLYLSQFHARIWELQKEGYKIEASTFKDEYGFVSYRLVSKVEQLSFT